MKQLIALLAVLLLVNAVYAQELNTTTTTTTTTTTSPFQLPTSLSGVYSFLVSINPILLVILGVALILFSKLAKFVGIVLIIIALIHLFFMFWK